MIQIQKGSILIYRVFDIAEEVNLARVEDLLKSPLPGAIRSRLKFTLTPRQTIIMRNAPITLGLGETEILFQNEPVKAEVSAKIWDYGVISILFQIPIPLGTTWEKLIEISARLEQDTIIDESAKYRAQDLSSLIQPALRDPHLWHEFEDYNIFFFEEIQGIRDCKELFNHVDVARLIVAENNTELSDRAKRSILESTLQYSTSDLCVIDWNSALVIEPSGKKEVPEAIEFALTHLMEMRYYDALLDQKLTTLYDSIEQSRGKFFSNRFSVLSREASARYIEFSEFIERVDNSFKVVGDFYLAKIFRVSNEEFRIPEWEGNILRKMGILSNLSALLQGEINVNRSLWLEITIVVLILFELITTFAKLAS
jgi:hypothetical protein